MEQLQQYWAIVKKQHFWILCGLAMLVPLVVFWVASGRLASAYAEQKSKISKTSTELQPLTAGDHPNKQWIDHVDAETAKLRTNVFNAWSSLYTKQQAILHWPAELGPDFIAAFSKPVLSDDPETMDVLCARYQNTVKTEISRMADVVRAKWSPSKADLRGAVAPPGAELPPENVVAKTYVVAWDPEDQEQLVKQFDWQVTPSPLAVRYAQEELWVREAIFKAIDQTNAGATGDFDAIVRQIDRSLIGYDATDRFPLSDGSNRIMRLRSETDVGIRGAVAGAPISSIPTTPGGPFEPKRPMAVGNNDNVRPTPNASGVTTPIDPDARLKDGRYVDEKGKALLGSEMDNTTTPEYRLMAFKIDIEADEQRWQRLLVELCNSPLPLQVREVRVDPQSALETRSSGGGIAGRRQRDFGGSGTVRHDLPVEIYGFAYLMTNPRTPANLTKLGIAATGEAPEAAAPSTPATVPPGPAAQSVPPAGAAPITPAPVAAPPLTPPAAAPPLAPPTTAPPTAAPPTTAPPTAPATPVGRP